MVNSLTLRPGQVLRFQEALITLCTRAVETQEAWHWTAHETRFGDASLIHFVYQAPDFAAVEQLGTVAELWQRVLGEERGLATFQQANECIEKMEHTISRERPDLSYPPDSSDVTEYPLAVLTTARARPGHAESCEELIRKLAEAIPKLDDAARIVTYQVMFGDLMSYWTVRPLRSLADLDAQLQAPDLLSQAFGPAEGGLIWRSGQEAIDTAERHLLAYREDLSNPPRA
jgi:hypothetical protein